MELNETLVGWLLLLVPQLMVLNLGFILRVKEEPLTGPIHHLATCQ